MLLLLLQRIPLPQRKGEGKATIMMELLEGRLNILLLLLLWRLQVSHFVVLMATVSPDGNLSSPFPPHLPSLLSTSVTRRVAAATMPTTTMAPLSTPSPGAGCCGLCPRLPPPPLNHLLPRRTPSPAVAAAVLTAPRAMIVSMRAVIVRVGIAILPLLIRQGRASIIMPLITMPSRWVTAAHRRNLL